MKSIFCIAVTLLCTFNSIAVTVTWTGGTGDWDVPGNWDTGNIPTAADDVFIGSSSNNVTIPSGYAAVAKKVDVYNPSHLEIAAGASLTIANSLTYGIWNSGTITNRGTLTVSNIGLSGGIHPCIFVGGQFENYGDIVAQNSLTGTTNGIHLYLNSSFTNRNGANISINNVSGNGIFIVISTSPVFTNEDGASLNISNTGDDGIYTNSGTLLNNSGNISIETNISGAGIYANGTVMNSSTGSISINNTTSYGLFLSQGTTNHGIITVLDNTAFNGIRYIGIFTNSPCGIIRTRSSMFGTQTLFQNGWLFSEFPGSHTGSVVNTGVIQDNANSFSSTTNSGVVLNQITGTYCAGDVISGALNLGNISGFSISSNEWYTSSGLGTAAGTYNPATNEFTPNANAVGQIELYIEFTDNSNSCTETMKVTFQNPIQISNTYYEDSDGDTYGDPASSTLSCSMTPPTGYVTDDTDCDDSDPLEFPTQSWFLDMDDDDYSDGTSLTQCERPTGYKAMSELSGTGDCDDNDPLEFPGQTWLADLDNDGYTDGTSLTQCERPTGYKAMSELTGTWDCDDSDPLEFPGQAWLADLDDDGYTDGTSSTQCERPTGYKLLGELTGTGDCDDNDPLEFPGQAWLADLDDDGYTDGTSSTQCERPTGYKLLSELTGTGDCDDNDPLEFPGQAWLADLDDDGYTDGTSSTQCERPTGYKLLSELTGTGDCDDDEPTMFPGNPEICDGLDNNCNGSIDEGVCIGNTCALPLSIGSLPYSYNGTTDGAGDDYDSGDACGANHMNGNDLVFTYNSPGGEIARIQLIKTGGEPSNDYSAHAVFLLDGCPDDPATTCIASATQFPSQTVNNPLYIETADFTNPGTYYIVVSSHATYHQWFDFSLTIDLPTGNVCENSYSIPSLPYSFNGTTQLLGDDYGSGDACGANHMGGNDVVFTYNSTGNEVARIQLIKTGGPSGNNYAAHAVFLLDGCPDDPATTCISSATHFPSQTVNEPIYIETVHFQDPGTYYIVVASHSIYHSWFDFNLTIDLPTGNICENSEIIPSLPFAYSGTTQLFGDDYDSGSACNANYMNANDYVFTYNSPGNEVAQIRLIKTGGPTGNNYSAHGVFLLDGCPDAPSTTCISSATHFPSQTVNEPIYIETVHFQDPGTYYIVVSNHSSYHQWFDFTLNIDLPTGNICENASLIPALPYEAPGQTTCLLGDDYDSGGACATSYINAHDHVYKYTAAVSGNIDIQLSNLSDDRTGIHFSDGCPNSGVAICTTMVNNGTGDYIFSDLAVTAGTDYYITISSHSTFTGCFIYDIAVGQSGFLPVEMVDFTAQKRDEKSVDLEWETASESNVSHFEIERSVDGKKWEQRGQAAAVGESDQSNFYSHLDDLGRLSPNIDGLVYYRLRIVDRDGSSAYSPIRSVRFEPSTQGISVFPNPNSGTFQVRLPANSGEGFELTLLETTGKILLQKSMETNGDEPITFGQEMDLPKGVHILVVRQNGQAIWQEKLVVL